MEHAMIPHERDRLNDEIERAFIETTARVIDIMTYGQTDRGTTMLQLYEDFYRWFSYLVMLTSDLNVVSNNGQEQTTKADRWINQKSQGDQENVLMRRCQDGIPIFLEYKKMLGQQGVISLPSG